MWGEGSLRRSMYPPPDLDHASRRTPVRYHFIIAENPHKHSYLTLPSTSASLKVLDDTTLVQHYAVLFNNSLTGGQHGCKDL